MTLLLGLELIVSIGLPFLGLYVYGMLKGICRIPFYEPKEKEST